MAWIRHDYQVALISWCGGVCEPAQLAILPIWNVWCLVDFWRSRCFMVLSFPTLHQRSADLVPERKPLPVVFIEIWLLLVLTGWYDIWMRKEASSKKLVKRSSDGFCDWYYGAMSIFSLFTMFRVNNLHPPLILILRYSMCITHLSSICSKRMTTAVWSSNTWLFKKGQLPHDSGKHVADMGPV